MKEIKIQRKRYIVQRIHDSAVLCGLAQQYHFKQIDNIGDTIIKTYSSSKKAVSAVMRSFNITEDEIRIIPVIETIKEIADEKIL